MRGGTNALSGDSRDARTDVVVPCRGGKVIHEGFSILCTNRQDYSVKRTSINPILISDYLRDRMTFVDVRE